MGYSLSRVFFKESALLSDNMNTGEIGYDAIKQVFVVTISMKKRQEMKCIFVDA
jgi:hypothetical protein